MCIDLRVEVCIVFPTFALCSVEIASIVLCMKTPMLIEGHCVYLWYCGIVENLKLCVLSKLEFRVNTKVEDLQVSFMFLITIITSS